LRIRTRSERETERVGEALGQALSAGHVERLPAVIALRGPLGAGKTRFVRGLARGLGAQGTVRSPTFTLIHEHRGTVPLYHVDLYRLGANDVEGLGLEELVDARAVTAIEWPDAAGEILPADHVRIEIRFGPDEDTRCLSIEARGARYTTLMAALRSCGFSQ
jgi:tRNA threonylcarbamoyladenosine biosynthesis protein TsaE